MSSPVGGLRLEGGWLDAAPLKTIFAAIRLGGSEARVVGGAVRDALTGRGAPGNVDLATPMPPDQVTKSARDAGLDVYPTGIKHGTVTIVIDGMPFEVTTLRRDVETDGRHAVVAYTNSWEEDAKRRDFTINALYCGEDGKVYDFTGGLDDLGKRRVRFIGDAAGRIREDYLRILRLFRFSSTFGNGHIDEAALKAASAEKQGLAQLSAERVRDELLKILASPHAALVVGVMQRHDILAPLLQPTHGVRLQRLCEIEAALGDSPDPIGRLAALALDSSSAAETLARRMRLSGVEAAALGEMLTVDNAVTGEAPVSAAKAAIYRHGRQAYQRAIKGAWARSDALPTDPGWRARYLLADRFRPPAMPFAGRDVLALGVAAGPRVGSILSDFETWWIGADFPADRAELISKLKALAAYA